MTRLPTLTLTAAWVLVSLCSGAVSQQPLKADSRRADIPSDWQVSLERTGCIGACPVYKVGVSADGSVTFRGRHDDAGAARLSAAEVRQLFELSKIDMPSDYKAEHDCDGPHETDWPSELISITMNGRSLTVLHNEGCKARPGTALVAVLKLSEAIDHLTDSLFVKD